MSMKRSQGAKLESLSEMNRSITNLRANDILPPLTTQNTN